MKKQVSIRDVAREAGVSPATVSYILNDTPNLSFTPETRERVLAAVEKLQDGDTVLIAEGCTHHRQCDDIGSVKIPRWLKNYTGKKLNIELCSGREFPDDLSKYALIIHCGGCMLNEREVRYRMKCAADQQVPITNYGIAIAYMHGILQRTVAPLPDIAKLLE